MVNCLKKMAHIIGRVKYRREALVLILELRSARCMLMQAMVLINVHTVDEKTNRRQHLI